ncbi:DUF1822 family protein [Crocosphaera watsonii WH 8501]|uniref:Uncharacterized protein n=1 Tax=Crocosphaera watsonii WH 8501 TaxID=165597 RepID=Q4C4K3_CROWT|nr:DUF1822 family protein [Crocosphaera watsonii]EAM51110.1 hypothetical protein CwatDRAFT_4196 [Crocosphaera watsonii WH 8501]
MMTVYPSSLTLMIPIEPEDHQMAERFSEGCKTFSNTEQVYLTTLAVSVVKSYLKIFDIDSQIRFLKAFNHVPYLLINDQQKLTYQSVLEDESTVQIAVFLPNSLGCALVEINEDMTQGKILVVVDSAVSQWVAIDELNLRSPEQFLSALQ